MKCIDCYKEGCSQRAYTADAECVFQQWTEKQFDWQSFRAEAAKDILCAMITADEGYIGVAGLDIHLAVDVADNLISKLKEKEEK